MFRSPTMHYRVPASFERTFAVATSEVVTSTENWQTDFDNLLQRFLSLRRRGCEFSDATANLDWKNRPRERLRKALCLVKEQSFRVLGWLEVGFSILMSLMLELSCKFLFFYAYSNCVLIYKSVLPVCTYQDMLYKGQWDCVCPVRAGGEIEFIYLFFSIPTAPFKSLLRVNT